MKKNRPAMFRFLPAKLSTRRAKRQIDEILKRYGSTCEIEFRETDAEIRDSYLVTSKLDRHLICEIIRGSVRRVGIPQRSV